ncbi:MAG: outer membrane protein assembly factor BamA, partial [Acidobacteriaceae bacterium]|nr:outer membrane protein assembly factor BamA [Acidobacteriaceae bacterium]
RYDYQTRGYFKAIVSDPKTKIRDVSGIKWYMPWKKSEGKVVDITMPIEEGDRYKLKEITFSGNKQISNTAALRNIFKMKDGDWFNAELVRKGLDDLKKAYGEFGYINATAVPDTHFDDANKTITLKIDIDEGKQFSVRRIEFVGNTTTRDKVIRRELALEEGGIYNSRLWELSLLRLNQLQYFEPLKAETDSETKQNNQDNTIDLTLKVKEKGKNSIGLTGGVSGLAGSFIGINYQTNNFLGLGETLTVEFNIGNRERNVMFGFTEPYVFDRPLQVGFTVFNRRYNYNQAQQASILTGQQVNLPQGVLNTLQNFTQNTTGFTVSASYPLRHSLKRVGLTYSFDTSSLTVFSQASQLYFETLAFSGLSGPNALQGVITSKVVPSVSWTTINSPQRPTSGRSFFFAGEVAGLGGTVRSLRPIVEYKQFIPMRGLKPTKDLEHRTGSLGVRFQGSFLTGYGGLVAPPFERFYLGGDTDLRGFDVRSVSPVAFLTQSTSVTLQNPDATFIPIDPANPRRGNVAVPIPVSQLVFPGGDTSLISNTEYRIPIVGPVTLAPFVDFGMNFVARGSQLRVTDAAFNALNTTGFGCGTLANFACVPTVPAGSIPFNRELTIIPGTNYVPRLSTGLELQVLMPIINAPFRVYWAYNPLLLDTTASTPTFVTRSMFPAGGAGDFTYRQTLQNFAPFYTLREPRKTFRFTVSTTF